VTTKHIASISTYYQHFVHTQRLPFCTNQIINTLHGLKPNNARARVLALAGIMQATRGFGALSAIQIQM